MHVTEKALFEAVESLAEGELDLKIAHARAHDRRAPVTLETIREYFSEGIYPYSSRLSLKEHDKLMYPLQVELVKMQNWVKVENQKLVILFDGRDAAGKGHTIRQTTENLNPRGGRARCCSR